VDATVARIHRGSSGQPAGRIGWGPPGHLR